MALREQKVVAHDRCMLRRLVVTAGAIVAIPAAVIVGWMLLPNTVFYRAGRPTRFGHLTNDVMARLYAIGLTPRIMSTLEVPGRSTGEVQSLPVVIAEYGGKEYLVSMLGERSEWIKNARAAGGMVTLRHRGARKVRLADVSVDDRAPILQAYLKRAIGARPHFPIGPDAPLHEFEAIAAGYPVFRIEPAHATAHAST